MAKGKKTGGKDFEPGHTYSKGRPALPLDLKGVKPLTEDRYKRTYTRYLEMPYNELEARMQDRTLPSIEHLFAMAIKAAIDSGNLPSLRDGFDRTLGKVKEMIAHEFPKPTVIKKRDGEEVILGVTPPEALGEDE